MIFDITNVWVIGTVYVALLIGGLIHIFPQILGILSKFKPLTKKVVRGLQVFVGFVLLLYLAMLLMV